MLANMSAKVRACYARAHDCAEGARRETDVTRRDELLRMERSWLLLARSYQLEERVVTFTRSYPRLPPARRPKRRAE